MENTENMIEVRNASKRFGGGTPVLCGVNMSVQKNTIYGLLGPSGCGKTTLLSCMLEMKKLTSGEIRLDIKSRKDVGYMPQEVALFPEFTVAEVLGFYASLFGLPEGTYKSRKEELKKVLDLPHDNHYIGKLSGGEQRRVSFAASMMHNPQLLLLDEPTVGLDPILNYSMWLYLEKLAALGKTIVITTHYIEEARNANKIAMMRGGKIIYEDTPKNTIALQQVNTLEDAFLKLILQESQQVACEPTKEKTPKESKTPSKRKVLSNGGSFNGDRMKAQLKKNFIWMKRNKTIMGLLLLLPLMQSFIYSISFGHDPIKLKLIILSGELSSDMNGFCEYYDHNSYTNGTPWTKIQENYYEYEDLNVTCTMPKPFTCAFAHLLSTHFDVEFAHNRLQAELDVIQNKAWGIIDISTNFSDSILERFIDQLNASKDILIRSEINVTLDMSNYILAKFIRTKLTEHINTFVEDMAEYCGMPRNLGSTPVRFMDPVFRKKDSPFVESGVPGFYSSFCFYFALIFTTGAIMMEKIIGTLERVMVAGMTYYEVILAHVVVQFALMTIQKVIMFIMFYILYENPLIGSPGLLLALLYFIEFVGISLGFLLTEIFEEDRLVTYAALGATLSVFSLGGIIWPLEGAHAAIKSVVSAYPIVPAIESYRSIALKGFEFAHSSVYLGFLSCILWVAIFSILGCVIRKAKRNN